MRRFAMLFAIIGSVITSACSNASAKTTPNVGIFCGTTTDVYSHPLPLLNGTWIRNTIQFSDHRPEVLITDVGLVLKPNKSYIFTVDYNEFFLERYYGLAALDTVASCSVKDIKAMQKHKAEIDSAVHQLTK